MGSISYRFLDEHMTRDDQVFYRQLGERIAALRRELGMTQVELADQLGISQQLIAAYEAGQRKIPASLLPTLSRMFAVPVEQLLGIQRAPAKRGPASRLQLQIERINSLPRAKQKFVVEMLEAIIQQQSAG